MPTTTIQSETTFTKRDLFWRIPLTIVVLEIIGFLFSHYPAEHGEEWYHSLNQPSFAPPYWLPFVMWISVYILMGIAVSLIWHQVVKNPDPSVVKSGKQALILFGIHFIFQLLTPALLVGLHWPVIALINMTILLAFIVLLIQKFGRISKTASYLLVPYLIWIIYAAALNVAVIVLN